MRDGKEEKDKSREDQRNVGEEGRMGWENFKELERDSLEDCSLKRYKK